jgi:ribosomal protein S18 acetylase RimI-like enzyme
MACIGTARESSEFWIGRARLLIDAEGMTVGGFIAMKGTELTQYRHADSTQLLKETPKAHLNELLAFLEATNDLFAPVTPDDFYLSKIGVLGPYRRRGLGKRLISDWLTQGTATGKRKFRLDVAATNTAAIELYKQFAFKIIHEGKAPYYELNYLSMQLVL